MQNNAKLYAKGCLGPRGGVRISEQRNYLTLEFRGKHYPRCYDRQIMNARKSDPSLCGFKSDLSAGGGSDDVESDMPVPKFSTLRGSIFHCHPPLCFLAQMATSVWCAVLPGKSSTILFLDLFLPVQLWMSCVARASSDAMSDALCSVTRVSIMIRSSVKRLTRVDCNTK